MGFAGAEPQLERLGILWVEWDRQCLQRSLGHRDLPTIETNCALEDAIAGLAARLGCTATSLRQSVAERRRNGDTLERALEIIIGGLP